MRQAGTWDSLGAIPAPGGTDTKKLWGIELGQIMNKKGKDQNLNCNFGGAGSKSTVPVHDFCTHTTKEMGRPLKTPLEHHPLDPLPVSTHGRNQLPESKQGTCSLVLVHPAATFKTCSFHHWVRTICWKRTWPSPPVYSSLENPTDRGAWQVTVQGVATSWTWRGTHTGCNISPN